MRRSILLLLVLCALLAAGCGGDDSNGGGGGGGGGGEATATEAPADDGGGETQTASSGKELFTKTCGGCHTLADAGTSGTVGPNLDDAKPDEQKVRDMIRTGGGAMPANLLQGDDAQAVAEYVAGAAGS
jgi:mono/diheme cytochrome c family protein